MEWLCNKVPENLSMIVYVTMIKAFLHTY